MAWNKDLGLDIEDDVRVVGEPTTTTQLKSYFNRWRVEQVSTNRVVGYIGETSNYWHAQPADDETDVEVMDSFQQALDRVIENADIGY